VSFKPEKIRLEHVLKAAELIDSGEYEITKSTGYDVVINGKKYPPKEIMRFAHEQATGEHLWKLSGGEPTNKYLKEMGFEITDKNEDDSDDENAKTYLLVNITWNSNNWKGISTDESGHKWVSKGNTPHESWNFDFDNSRNTPELIRGYCQFTKPPKVIGKNNLIVFYSANQIVGFYGNAEVLSKAVNINKKESYNLIGARPLCILLKNKIANVKEKGYLEDKQRVGQIGFSYLYDEDNVKSIINEAILLNPEEETKLNALLAWLELGEVPVQNYWVFQANPTKVYRIADALKAGILKSWMIKQ